MAEACHCLFLQLPALQEQDVNCLTPVGSQGQLHHWVCSGPQGWTTESLEHGPLPHLPHVPGKAAEAACCGVCPGCFAPMTATPVGPVAL